MKHKVGDEVQVKSLDWYNTNKNKDGNVILKGPSFTEYMSEFCGQIVTIKEIKNNQYIIEEDDFGWDFTDEMFEECVCLNSELCHNKNNIQIIDITPLKQQKIIWTESAPDTTELVIGENYELVMEDGVYKVIKKKPKYPKTYKECCEVLDCKADHFFTNFSYKGCDIEISDYEYKINDLLQNFRKLRYCRDAYWKIAGEKMGLDKPWGPDFTQDSGSKYSMLFANCVSITGSRILAFPTQEMRDAFYENFKDLIEGCKELL